MATVLDVATGALRRLGVLAIGEEADALMIDVALSAYNGLMAEATVAGWIDTFAAQGLTDTVPLGPEQTEPLKAAVAVRIAPDFEREPSRRLALDARLFQAQLAAAGYTVATFERALRYETPGEYPDVTQ